MAVAVLMVATELRRAGAEQVVFELATRLDPERFRVSVAALDGRGRVAAELRRAGIPAYDLGAAVPLRLDAILRLRALLRRERPGLVHAHLIHASVAARLAAARTGIPTLSTVHIAERRGRVWPFALDRWTARGCRRWVAVSRAVADYHAARARLPRDRFTVIHNGIDLGRFRPASGRAAAKEALGFDPRRLLVGAVGRFDRQKGMDVYLDAAGLALEREPSLQFLLAGCGPEEAALRTRAAQEDLAGRVRFLGFQEEPERVYRALDLLVFPSRYEGFGLVLVEAMACGIPAVASSVDSVPEIAGDSEAVVLVPPETPQAIATAVLRLAASEAERTAAGAAARRRAEDFALSAMVKAHEALYEELLSGEGRR